MQPSNSNHELIRRGLSLLTKGLRPFIEREMRSAYGQDWELEARIALKTPPGVRLHWDSQATLNIIDRRWNEVFRNKLERKHRSWAVEAVSLRHDLMHETKEFFTDKETRRGLDTFEFLLTAVSAPESQEIERLKNTVGDEAHASDGDHQIRESMTRTSRGQPRSLPISLVPSDPVTFKQELLRSRVAEIVTTFSDGRIETRIWRAANFSSSSNVIGNLRSRPNFRAGQWEARGIAKVTVRVLNNA